jgi:hypothetical protein
MGRHLNSEYDNLLFPVFGSPARFRWSYERLQPYVSVFEKLHLDRTLAARDWLLLGSRLLETHNRPSHLRNLRYALQPSRSGQRASCWGWKNGPNQFFLPQLTRHFPAGVYVHTLRHGLDMAYSKNLRQLDLWGPHVGITSAYSDAPVPVQQLALWIETTRSVSQYCAAYLPSRHYLLRFDELCQFPERVISQLFEAIGLRTQTPVSQLAGLVEPPRSLGRYRARDTTIFTPAQLTAVQALGFTI